MNKRLWAGLCLAVCAAAVPSALLSAPADEKAFCQGITRPSEDVTLSFVRPGRVAKCNVKQGDAVTAGQVLVEQDNTVEKIKCEQLKAKAEDTVRSRHAEAQLQQKKVDLKRTQQAAEKNAATELEVEHARLEVVVADLSLELTKFETTQDMKDYEQSKAELDRMSIVSPVAGRVEKIQVRVGEGVDALKDVIRVVNTAVLWLDVPVPQATAETLKLGGKAELAYPSGAPGEGKIIDISAVGDPAGATAAAQPQKP
jgi:HlyD family secretion protein